MTKRPAASKSARSAQSLGWTLLKYGIALWAIWYLVHAELLDFSVLKRLLTPSLWLPVSALLFLALVAVSALRWWRLMVAIDLRPTYPETLIANYVSLAVGQLLPSTVGGEVIRIVYALKRFPHARGSGTLTVLADRALGLIGLGIVGAVAVMPWLGQAGSSPLLHGFWVACMALALGGSVALGIALVFTPRLAQVLARRHMPRLINRLGNRLLPMAEMWRSCWRALPEAVVWSIPCQLAMAGAIYAMSVHLQFDISFGAIIVASCTAQLAGLLPLTPGGLGISEMAFAAALAALGYNATEGLATIMLAYRAVALLLVMPGLIIYVMRRNL